MSGLEFRPANAWVIADVSSAVCRGTPLHTRYIASASCQDPYSDYRGLEWVTRCEDQLFATLADIATMSRQLNWHPPATDAEVISAEQLLMSVDFRCSRSHDETSSEKIFGLTLNVSFLQK